MRQNVSVRYVITESPTIEFGGTVTIEVNDDASDDDIHLALCEGLGMDPRYLRVESIER